MNADAPSRELHTSPAARPPVRRKVLRAAAWIAGVVALTALVFLLVPPPIDPLPWNPPAAPATAAELTHNQELTRAQLVTPVPDGPEDITFDAEGRLYTGDESGTIYRVSSGGQPERFANTGGRPNGLRFAPDGHLIVADTRRGLLSVDQAGTVQLLAESADGKPIALANELAVAADGTIYFSDSSRRSYDHMHLVHELLEQRPSGRLLRYDPHTKRTDVLLTDLSLANGVALAPDESYVLVAESFRYRIDRYWLTGPKAGTHDIFIDNLPGFPDNLTSAADGSYWIALYQPRDADLDRLQRHPFLKAQLAKLPDALIAGSIHASTALHLSATGQPIGALSDTTGHIYGLTTATPHDGYLYLGTDHNGSNDVMRVPLH